ncbi:MAG: hypothetical protein AAGE52_15815 [Myxococcota bacterium]
MKRLDRREWVRLALAGSGGITLAALASGLPRDFLETGRVAHAQEGPEPTFFVFAFSPQGDPLNANCPGSYPNPSDESDIARNVEHPTTAELGRQPLGTIDGQPYFAADLESGTACRIGGDETWAARPWADLPAALRNRMSIIRHRTLTNAHAEMNSVLDFHSAIKGPGRVGVETFPSLIAQETHSRLGTVLEGPVSLAGSFSYRGVPVRRQTPDTLEGLFAGAGRWAGFSDSDFALARDAVLDAVYRDSRMSGTPAQRRFIDNHARSRRDARDLSSTLGASLAPIGSSDNNNEKRAIAVAALFKHRVTPVVAIRLPFGGDNHADSNLETEALETIQGVDGIHRLWQELTVQGLEDQVTFAILNCFGRTLNRTGGGGRSHHGNDHVMVTFGPRVEPGLVGSLVADDRGRLEAGPIADIPMDESLASVGKTVAKACGVPDEVIDERIVGGRVIA